MLRSKLFLSISYHVQNDCQSSSPSGFFFEWFASPIYAVFLEDMFNSLQSSLLNNKFNLLQSCFIMISIPTHIYDVLEFHVVVFRRHPITIDACF